MRAEPLVNPAVPEATLASVASLISENMGLHFPPSRHADLLRGLTSAARERDFADCARYARWLLSTQPTPTDFQALARHLTVGETYFFREHKTLEALSQ